MLKKVAMSYLMLFVLAVLAVVVSFIPSPINIMPNPSNLTGTAVLLNPDYRPQPGQAIPTFTGDQGPAPWHSDSAPNLFLLLDGPNKGL